MVSFKKMVKKMFSFSLWDVFGILMASIFIKISTKDELFLLFTEPRFYILLFLLFFLVHSWFWLFRYRAEKLYLKGCVKHIFVDYIHVLLVFSCTIGSYFLIIHFLK